MERLENSNALLQSFITAFEHSAQSEQALRDQVELCDKISIQYKVPEASVYLIARKLQQTDELIPTRFGLELQHEQYKIEDLKYDIKSTCKEVRGIVIWERSIDVKSKTCPQVQCQVYINDLKQELVKLVEQVNHCIYKYGKQCDIQIKLALKDLYENKENLNES